MPFKPNYRQQRAERSRVKEQRKQEKLQKRREDVERRKAAGEEPPKVDDEPPGGLEASWRTMMAKKEKRAESGYVLYDVLYEDGSRSSNRKVPAGDIDPFDRAASVLGVLERQDQKIAEASGKPRPAIKSVSLAPG